MCRVIRIPYKQFTSQIHVINYSLNHHNIIFGCPVPAHLVSCLNGASNFPCIETLFNVIHENITFPQQCAAQSLLTPRFLIPESCCITLAPTVCSSVSPVASLTNPTILAASRSNSLQPGLPYHRSPCTQFPLCQRPTTPFLLSLGYSLSQDPTDCSQCPHTPSFLLPLHRLQQSAAKTPLTPLVLLPVSPRHQASTIIANAHAPLLALGR